MQKQGLKTTSCFFPAGVYNTIFQWLFDGLASNLLQGAMQGHNSNPLAAWAGAQHLLSLFCGSPLSNPCLAILPGNTLCMHQGHNNFRFHCLLNDLALGVYRTLSSWVFLDHRKQRVGRTIKQLPVAVSSRSDGTIWIWMRIFPVFFPQLSTKWETNTCV